MLSSVKNVFKGNNKDIILTSVDATYVAGFNVTFKYCTFFHTIYPVFSVKYEILRRQARLEKKSFFMRKQKQTLPVFITRQRILPSIEQQQQKILTNLRILFGISNICKIVLDLSF